MRERDRAIVQGSRVERRRLLEHALEPILPSDSCRRSKTMSSVLRARFFEAVMVIGIREMKGE